MKLLQLLFILCIWSCELLAQAYSIRTFNWKDAGYKSNAPIPTLSLNIMNYGGNNTNSTANNVAFTAALTALNGSTGVIYFPKGIYNFTAALSINRDSITLAGAGYDSTQLRFNMNGAINNCININGTQVNTDTSSFSSPGLIDSNWVQVLNSSPFQIGDWVHLTTTDNAIMFSSWAYGSLGQIMQIKNIAGNTISFHSPFRYSYGLALKPKIRKIIPRKEIIINCLKIVREESTASQTSLISFDKAVNCKVHGVEGDSTNFAHIELNKCCHVEISNCWFHHAHAYGGNGQGYGITFQYSTSECKAENNIFNHLRHSILFQAGANGNVCGYNYSFDPYWTQGIFPTNSAGDIVMHGNFPFANLCEGNINQHTVLDNSHANSGPYNTFFRNRSELYGLFMNNSPATDSAQFLGLEVTGTGGFLGQYVLAGNGHVQHANMVQGVLTPTNPAPLTENSLYLMGNERPLCFTPGLHNWPVIGQPNPYNSGSNAARDRYSLGRMASCACTNLITRLEDEFKKQAEFHLYPNPAKDILHIKCDHKIETFRVYNAEGKLLLNSTYLSEINLSAWPKGLYLLHAAGKNFSHTQKFWIN
ncbi:MAG: T9SS type A sorting domain-containing protein [Sphingobacteriaceae bacterium]|nr:T9SS type A sorting domain-containing protein [Sphingobacteriaceae bacterium]